MKKYLITLCIFLIFGQFSYAQNKLKPFSKNSLYVEAGLAPVRIAIFLNIHVASSYSINYERQLPFSQKWEKINLNLRLGFGNAIFLNGLSGRIALAGVTLLTGKGNHHFEVSSGAFLSPDKHWTESDGIFVHPLIDLGYRFQNPAQGPFSELKSVKLWQDCLSAGLFKSFFHYNSIRLVHLQQPVAAQRKPLPWGNQQPGTRNL